MAESPGDVTVLLARMRSGHNDALEQLLPLVYNELRRLAAHYMRQERAGHTLQPTALVHEAYLRLTHQDRANWQNRAQFMGVAGQLMRRILVDHARANLRQKRGAGAEKIALDEGVVVGAQAPSSILELDDALERLAAQDRRKSEIVEMLYFGGMTYEETAAALAISPATVHRELRLAKAWLHRELAGG